MMEECYQTSRDGPDFVSRLLVRHVGFCVWIEVDQELVSRMTLDRYSASRSKSLVPSIPGDLVRPTEDLWYQDFEQSGLFCWKSCLQLPRDNWRLPWQLTSDETSRTLWRGLNNRVSEMVFDLAEERCCFSCCCENVTRVDDGSSVSLT